MILKTPRRQTRKRTWVLTEREMDALDYSMIFPKERWEIYNIFCAPSLSEAQCRSKASALWNSMDAREYIEMRTVELQRHFYPDKMDVEEDDDISKEDLQKVKKLVVKKAMDETDASHWDAVKLVAPRAFKDDDIGAEAPRRYLPVMCRAAPCRYLAYCELNLADGCKYCRYRKYAHNHGVHYDHKDMLDIPLDDPIRKLFDPIFVEDDEELEETKPTQPKKAEREELVRAEKEPARTKEPIQKEEPSIDGLSLTKIN